MIDRSRPISDWVRMEGKRCDACAHHSIVKIRLRGPVEIECCDLHQRRACVVTRHPSGECGPTAKDWVRA